VSQLVLLASISQVGSRPGCAVARLRSLALCRQFVIDRLLSYWDDLVPNSHCPWTCEVQGDSQLPEEQCPQYSVVVLNVGDIKVLIVPITTKSNGRIRSVVDRRSTTDTGQLQGNWLFEGKGLHACCSHEFGGE
jgi:hypothetical protein